MNVSGWMLGQAQQFFVALLSGLCLAFFYDLYQGLLRRGRHLRRGLFLRDTGFGLCMVALALLLWFGLTDGSLRLAVFFWMLLGALFYVWLFSPRLHTELWFLHRKKPDPRPKQPRKTPHKSSKRQPKAWNKRAAGKILRWGQKLRNRASRAKEGEESKKDEICH